MPGNEGPQSDGVLFGDGGEKRVEHETPELYHLLHDPSEKYNIAGDHPEVIEQIRKLVAEHKKTVKPVENQLETPLK